MRIVHEDDRLLALDKPAGQLTIPGRRFSGIPSLHEEAQDHLGRRLWIVHRIDRETSGLVAFAKDADCHRELCRLFEDRLVEKRYLALVLGSLGTPGRVNRPIRECGSGRSAVCPRNGKPAATAYTPLEPLEGATLLETRPESGRRHQIRVHLYSIGHPIIGDTQYGAERPVGGGSRLMLHAAGLVLEIPGGDRLVLECPPGADWDAELEGWRTPSPIDRHAPPR